MQPVILDQLPPGLLEREARELAGLLDGPTLIHLPGVNPQPLFVSVLQHGNEWSGWDAVRRLLKGRYARDPLPRSLALFIGNVRAAAHGLRRLADQPDFNRCWAVESGPQTAWHGLFAQITEHMRSIGPFASIDIHNNTGLNPHYAAINALEPQCLHLAARFSQTAVYFTEPRGVQSVAFGAFCPAVTLECGLAGESNGTDHALAYLESVLQLEEIPDRMPASERLDVFGVAATVKVPVDVDFSFGHAGHGLQFDADLDRLNFAELPPGSALARINGDPDARLLAFSQDGVDQSGLWFEIRDGVIRTRRAIMPAMLSTRPEIVRQDCLCYLMERLPLRAAETEPVQAGHELPETLP